MKRHPSALIAAIPVGANTTYFFRMCADVFQERGFTRSGLPGQEDGLTCMSDQLQGILKLLIICV